MKNGMLILLAALALLAGTTAVTVLILPDEDVEDLISSVPGVGPHASEIVGFKTGLGKTSGHLIGNAGQAIRSIWNDQPHPAGRQRVVIKLNPVRQSTTTTDQAAPSDASGPMTAGPKAGAMYAAQGPSSLAKSSAGPDEMKLLIEPTPSRMESAETELAGRIAKTPEVVPNEAQSVPASQPMADGGKVADSLTAKNEAAENDAASSPMEDRSSLKNDTSVPTNASEQDAIASTSADGDTPAPAPVPHAPEQSATTDQPNAIQQTRSEADTTTSETEPASPQIAEAEPSKTTQRNVAATEKPHKANTQPKTKDTERAETSAADTPELAARPPAAPPSDTGDADHQEGLRYYRGTDGVEKDYRVAATWFNKSAAKGNAKAQYNLGIMAYLGQGMKQSYEQAANWFEQAAKQGHALAQYNLGFLYYEGKGLDKDNLQAFMWIDRAARTGDKKAIEARSTLEKVLPNDILGKK